MSDLPVAWIVEWDSECGRAKIALIRKDEPSMVCFPPNAITYPVYTRAPSAPSAGVDDVWRCFHCDESFTDAESATEHFGASERQNPACQIDIAEYRAMEARMVRYNDEDADIHRAMRREAGEYQQAIRRAEEDGYAKGVADARKEAGVDEVARDAESALRFGAQVIQLWDDATMLDNYMADSNDCAAILNILADHVGDAAIQSAAQEKTP